LVMTYTAERDWPRAASMFRTAIPTDALPQSTMQQQVWAARAELALAQDEPQAALEMVEQLLAVCRRERPTGCSPVRKLSILRQRGAWDEFAGPLGGPSGLISW